MDAATADPDFLADVEANVSLGKQIQDDHQHAVLLSDQHQGEGQTSTSSSSSSSMAPKQGKAEKIKALKALLAEKIL